ncbi:MAG: NUMOD4 motif-containing HNH endonuclease [Selenomonadaceae bacterium]|nr:NUMOD4 motif-containing HNH endonuclease [Selenomonadaceae bacterium]MBQ3434170.1 NUMOD4 motif-containing HNH endonuclease [Selenomonadaceae bacterium]
MGKYEKAKADYCEWIKVYPFTPVDLEGEVWVSVAGYGKNSVSNFGRVKSFAYGRETILTPVVTNNGYLSVGVYDGQKQSFIRVSRLVAQTFVPNPQGKTQVNHIDGIKFNNHASNLEWVTDSENKQHAIRLGLKRTGIDNPFAKLTAEQVVYIRDNPDNLSGKKLAEKFGVHKSVIYDVQRGVIYKNCGGKIRGVILPKKKILEEIRRKIRDKYQRNVPGAGSKTLARKYHCDPSTILSIVKEK